MDNRIKELFERYQAGQATPEEKKLVDDWFAGFNDQGNEILEESRKAAFFDQLDEKIHGLFPVHEKKYWLIAPWLQVAAVLFIGLSIFLFKILGGRHDITSPVTYTFISAPNGTKKQLTLSDGSCVYLNSGSQIGVPSDFGVKNRRIFLSGEAFFVVTHNPSKPFSIKSGKLIIADIGTSFNVKAYPDEGEIKVAVESGEVCIKKSDSGDELKTIARSLVRNQQLTYNNKSEGHMLNYVQTSDISSWKQNQLRFENASFNDIAHTLERWYNVKITLKNDNPHLRHYTVSFNNEPVDQVLYVLERLSGLHYQIDNRNIVVNLNNCKKQ